LLTIVHRSALNRLRSIKRRRAVPIEPERDRAGEYGAAHAAASRQLERSELRSSLMNALNQLSPVQREVVLLADLEDWSHADIAAKTGLSVTMSRRHLSDARRKLRGLLASLGLSSPEHS
jgi:RNA polymerase sigma-70 factor (ECF subfamily)